MAKRFLIPAITLGLLLSVPVVAAQGQGKGQAKGHAKPNAGIQGDDHGDKSKGLHRGNDKIHNDNKSKQRKAVKAFGKKDRDIIVGYLHEHQGGLPPGLGKRDDLLPGLEKQLRRNGHLPPGLEKKIEPFPPGLEAHFPPLMPGYKRGIVHGRALIYQPDGLIVDAVALF